VRRGWHVADAQRVSHLGVQNRGALLPHLASSMSALLEHPEFVEIFDLDDAHH